jgi:hypothetical protein
MKSFNIMKRYFDRDWISYWYPLFRIKECACSGEFYSFVSWQIWKISICNGWYISPTSVYFSILKTSVALASRKSQIEKVCCMDLNYLVIIKRASINKIVINKTYTIVSRYLSISITLSLQTTTISERMWISIKLRLDINYSD